MSTRASKYAVVESLLESIIKSLDHNTSKPTLGSLKKSTARVPSLNLANTLSMSDLWGSKRVITTRHAPLNAFQYYIQTRMQNIDSSLHQERSLFISTLQNAVHEWAEMSENDRVAYAKEAERHHQQTRHLLTLKDASELARLNNRYPYGKPLYQRYISLMMSLMKRRQPNSTQYARFRASTEAWSRLSDDQKTQIVELICTAENQLDVGYETLMVLGLPGALEGLPDFSKEAFNMDDLRIRVDKIWKSLTHRHKEKFRAIHASKRHQHADSMIPHSGNSIGWRVCAFYNFVLTQYRPLAISTGLWNHFSIMKSLIHIWNREREQWEWLWFQDGMVSHWFPYNTNSLVLSYVGQYRPILSSDSESGISLAKSQLTYLYIYTHRDLMARSFPLDSYAMQFARLHHHFNSVSESDLMHSIRMRLTEMHPDQFPKDLFESPSDTRIKSIPRHSTLALDPPDTSSTPRPLTSPTSPKVTFSITNLEKFLQFMLRQPRYTPFGLFMKDYRQSPDFFSDAAKVRARAHQQAEKMRRKRCRTDGTTVVQAGVDVHDMDDVVDKVTMEGFFKRASRAWKRLPESRRQEYRNKVKVMSDFYRRTGTGAPCPTSLAFDLDSLASSSLYHDTDTDTETDTHADVETGILRHADSDPPSETHLSDVQKSFSSPSSLTGSVFRYFFLTRYTHLSNSSGIRRHNDQSEEGVERDEVKEVKEDGEGIEEGEEVDRSPIGTMRRVLWEWERAQHQLQNGHHHLQRPHVNRDDDSDSEKTSHG